MLRVFWPWLITTVESLSGGRFLLFADDSIDSEHYVDGSIDTAHIVSIRNCVGGLLNFPQILRKSSYSG